MIVTIIFLVVSVVAALLLYKIPVISFAFSTLSGIFIVMTLWLSEGENLRQIYDYNMVTGIVTYLCMFLVGVVFVWASFSRTINYLRNGGKESVQKKGCKSKCKVTDLELCTDCKRKNFCNDKVLLQNKILEQLK